MPLVVAGTLDFLNIFDIICSTMWIANMSERVAAGRVRSLCCISEVVASAKPSMIVSRDTELMADVVGGAVHATT
jgi:hypothetical protein